MTTTNNLFKKHILYTTLGEHVRDRVTGFEGVATTLCFDLYGCVQIYVTQAFDAKEGKFRDGGWFDVARLEIVKGSNPVMPAPTFGAINDVEIARSEIEKRG